MLQYRNRLGKVIGAAQHSLDLCHQHALVEGLYDKVIGTHVHGHYDIHVVGGRGDEDHRHLGYFADLTAPVIAVEKGQADIQQHQMRSVLGKLRHDAPKVLDNAGLQFPLLRLFLDGLRDTAVIFNN